MPPVRLALAVNLVALLCTAPYFFHMVVREDHDNEESEVSAETGSLVTVLGAISIG